MPGNRYRYIAKVLARHGLGYLADDFGLERFIPFHRGLLGHDKREQPYTQPEHVRLALEDLGATFIKFGQILSTRPDLLSPDYVRELGKLQDAAPPADHQAVMAAITSELGVDPDALFARFDHAPLAAASIGQVHGAQLKGGAEVVVKVRRPGVVERVHEDVEILKNLAARAARRWPAAENYDLVGLADEFGETIRAELDYVREARNVERCARNFADDASIHIPKVFWQTSTSRVLTLERVGGIKINDLDGLAAAGIDRKALAQRLAQLALVMVFEHGFFHADPHPGNFFIEPDGRIALIDFGMVGTVDERGREQLARLLFALTTRETVRLTDEILDIAHTPGRIDRGGLQQDIERLLGRYYDRQLGEIPLGEVLQGTLAIVRRHHLQLPADLALLFKMLIMSEGLGARLDPEFHLIQEVTPYAERLIMRQYSPTLWAPRLAKAGFDAARLATELPTELRRVLSALDQSNLEFGIRHETLEPLVDRLDRLANRLVLSILAAAFIVGLAVLMLVYHPAGWEEWASVTFAIGFAIAALAGTYLAWTIIRPRQKGR